MEDFKNYWAKHETKHPQLLSHINQYFVTFSVQFFLLNSLPGRLQHFYRQTQFFIWATAVWYALLTTLQHRIPVLSLTSQLISCKEIEWIFQLRNNFQESIEQQRSKGISSSVLWFMNQWIQNTPELVIQPVTGWTAWCLGLPTGNWGSFHFPQLCAFCAI